MHIVTLALRGPHSAALPAAVLDVLWVVASFEEGIEHLHAKCPEPGEGLGYLTFFIKAATLEKAAALARGIACRALDNSPALAGWSLAPGLV